MNLGIGNSLFKRFSQIIPVRLRNFPRIPKNNRINFQFAAKKIDNKHAFIIKSEDMTKIHSNTSQRVE